MIVDDIESTLIIFRDEKEIYPLSTFAFNVTQRNQKDLEKVVGSLVVYRNGSVKKIVSASRVGFYGVDFFEKAKNALFGVYEIRVCLMLMEMSLTEISELISDYLILDSKKTCPVFEIENIDDISLRVRFANSVDDIFRLISVPDPENCLDIL